ncbi:hypothetical protein CFE70_010117 [Pyrenophora teres f. teres 0-1]
MTIVVFGSGLQSSKVVYGAMLATNAREEVSDRAQDRRSRSPLRNLEPSRTVEDNHWSPEEEETYAVAQYSPVETNGYSQYGNGSEYGIEYEDTPFHDVYMPTHDHPDMSRTGYHDHHEVDWNGRVSNSDSTKSMSHHEHSNTPPAIQNPRAVGQDKQNQTKPQEAPKLGLPHLLAAKDIQAPPTAYDLRLYNARICDMYANLPREQKFRNGNNGKVAPSIYGSETRHDLGLCFATFLTRSICEMGPECPWRHHPLSIAEKIWIIEYGNARGKQFLENVERCYTCPRCLSLARTCTAWLKIKVWQR